MVACMMRIEEVVKGLDNIKIKGNNKYCFIFLSWSALEKSAESAKDHGDDFVLLYSSCNKF